MLQYIPIIYSHHLRLLYLLSQQLNKNLNNEKKICIHFIVKAV